MGLWRQHLRFAVKMAGEVGVEINKVMMIKIDQEERLGDNREKVGFL